MLPLVFLRSAARPEDSLDPVEVVFESPCPVSVRPLWPGDALVAVTDDADPIVGYLDVGDRGGKAPELDPASLVEPRGSTPSSRGNS